MGLFGNLLGTGKSAQFNKTVDTIIRNDYGVEIDSTANPKFPAIMKYRAMTDEVKYDNASPEAAALRVLIPYYGGIVKSDSPAVQAEARELIEKIKANMRQYLETGKIKRDRFEYYSNVLFKHTGQRV